MDQLKYDSLYSGLVSINKSLGGTQSMPDSEYGAMIDLMETLSGQPVGESGDAYDAVSTVATMAENGELPIQSTPNLDSVDVDITANGSYEYQPSAYGLDGFSRFTANVNVPNSSRLGVESVNMSENGHQEFHAIDFDLDGFSTIGIDVNVSTGGEGTMIDVGRLGLKFGHSTFSTVPDVFDFSNVLYMYSMFQDCSSLTTIPLLNTSTAINMNYMFQGCSKLTTIPQLDTSNVNSMSYMFRDCSELTTIPQLDTSKVTNMGYMFEGCSKLTTIPQLDTSKVTNMEQMFDGCKSLESIPMLDFSKVGIINNFFGYSWMGGDYQYLTNLGGFGGLKIDWNDGGGLSKCPNLTVDSLMNVINNVYDFVGNGSTTTRTLQLGTTNLDKLTDEQKAVATNKGWSLK